MLLTLIRVIITSILLSSSAISLSQNFSSTFLQYSYGWNNDDYINGANPSNGKMNLITLDHLNVTQWGGFYGFVNYMIAPDEFYLIGFHNKTIDSNNGRYRLYSEIAPWISIPNLLGKKLDNKIIKDVSLETQLNIGVNFFAGLVGIGFTFNTPPDRSFKISTYWRRDNIRENTMQFTGVFDFPISKKLGLKAQGYFDLIPYAKNRSEYGSTILGTDFVSQIRFLYDAGRHTLFKNDTNTKLDIGVDVYMHFNKDMATHNVYTFVPQPCIRLSF